MTDEPKIMSLKPCRRCSECVGCEHHWLDNTEFGAINECGLDRPDATGNEYMCKHCPAVGDECENCGGDGSIDGKDDECSAACCPTCRGRGVIVARPKRFEELDLA